MKKILALALSAVLMTSVLTGCSGNSGSEITLYDGINSEMQLIHKMVELVVEDKTDVEVTIKDQMSAVKYVPGAHPGRSQLRYYELL